MSTNSATPAELATWLTTHQPPATEIVTVLEVYARDAVSIERQRADVYRQLLTDALEQRQTPAWFDTVRALLE